VRVAGGLDQLGRYPHPVALPAHRALHDVPHPERVGDLGQRQGAVLESQHRRPRDDLQTLDLRELADDLVGDPLAEVLVRRRAPDVIEGQDRHRRGVRSLRGRRGRAAAAAAIGEHENEEDDGENGGGDDPATDGGEEAVPVVILREGRLMAWNGSGEPRQLRERAPQVLRQLAGRLVAILRLLHETAADDRDDHRRHVGPRDVHQRGVHGELLREHAFQAGPGEGHPPRDHLVQHAAQTVEIAAPVHRRGRRGLLRAHVGRGPDRKPDPGERRAAGEADRPCDAEIRHHRMTVRDEDVLRLDVSMNHAAPVGVVERVGDFPGDRHRLGGREPRLGHQPVAQALAFHERHHGVEQVPRLARIEQRHDVRVLKLRGDPDLAQKALRAHRRCDVGIQHLDRDRALVAAIAREIDVGHPATAELPLDDVAVAQDLLDMIEEIAHAAR
jgi:hypothetical protein